MDGSKKSMETLEYIRRIRSPEDKVTVIICEQGNIDATKVRETVMYDLEEKDMHMDSMIVILNSEKGRRTADIIREYLISEVEKYIDIIFIGN